ncbi:MAG: chorismate mutase [SAR202 cluster bacterium]|nr:chorismate mutase [SAR202 cluster bacterium]|tara:strand:+ start:1110 stop:1487 length:378 start_codon:yes stop_codon:yes gene_type:complete
MGKVIAIRGATTAESNTKDSIVKATSEMLEELVSSNDLNVEDIISAFFTTTRDLNTQFPAVAARKIGWEYVALMCSHEMFIDDAQPMCIRVMVHVNSEKDVKSINNVYLNDAINLRKRGFETDKN